MCICVYVQAYFTRPYTRIGKCVENVSMKEKLEYTLGFNLFGQSFSLPWRQLVLFNIDFFPSST